MFHVLEFGIPIRLQVHVRWNKTMQRFPHGIWIRSSTLWAQNDLWRKKGDKKCDMQTNASIIRVEIRFVHGQNFLYYRGSIWGKNRRREKSSRFANRLERRRFVALANWMARSWASAVPISRLQIRYLRESKRGKQIGNLQWARVGVSNAKSRSASRWRYAGEFRTAPPRILTGIFRKLFSIPLLMATYRSPSR